MCMPTLSCHFVTPSIHLTNVSILPDVIEYTRISKISRASSTPVCVEAIAHNAASRPTRKIEWRYRFIWWFLLQAASPAAHQDRLLRTSRTECEKPARVVDQHSAYGFLFHSRLLQFGLADNDRFRIPRAALCLRIPGDGDIGRPQDPLCVAGC